MNREQKQAIVFMFLINKMLKPHGVDIEYVMQNKEIEGKPWYQYYTWTEEEERKYKKEAIAYLRQVFYWSKKRAEKELLYFLMNYGLKAKYENTGTD